MALLDDINAEMASRTAASGAPAPAAGSDAVTATASPLKDAIDAEIASRQAAAPAPVATPGLGVFPSDKDYVAPLTTTYPDSVPFAKQLNYMHDLSRQTTRMFGGDYVNAAARSIGNMVSGKPADYSGALAQERRDNDAFAGANPVMSTAASLTGGLAAAPVAGLAAPASVPAAIASGVKIGASLGALGGAGYSHGTTPGEVAADAGEGALGGAALGVALPTALAAGKVVAQRFSPNASVDARLGKIIQTNADAGGPSIEEMQATLAQTPDKPLMLADVLGEGNPIGTLYRSGGAPKQIIKTALAGRDETAPDRIGANINEAFAPNGKTAFSVKKDLSAQQSTDAAPLYKDAFGNSGPVINDRIQAFIDDPIVKQGLKQGLEVQRLEALAKGEKFDPMDYGIKGFNDAGDPIMGPTPNLRLLDAGKRGMDDILETYRDPVTGRLNLDQRGNAINQVRAAYIKAIDQQLGGDGNIYQQARQAWSGPAQSKGALRTGQTLLHRSPEEIADIAASSSPSDLQFVKQGLAETLNANVNKAGDAADEAKRILGNRYMRNQLAPLFDNPADFQNFVNNATAEKNMFATKFGTMGGSQTQERNVADTGGKASNAGLAATTALATGNAPAALGIMGARGLQKLGGASEAANIALARALTTTQGTPVTERMLYGVDRSLLPSDQLARLAQALKSPSLLTPGTALAAEQGGPATTRAMLKAGPYGVGLARSLQQMYGGEH